MRWFARPGRGRRVALLVLLALVLAPGTWLRTDVRPRSLADVTIARISLPPAEPIVGFTREGLWRLEGTNQSFGGFSAIAAFPDRLRLFSDRGWFLTMGKPGAHDIAPEAGLLFPSGFRFEDLLDIESVTSDRETGQFWIGYERLNILYRYSSTEAPESWVHPRFTRHWGENSGMEAIVRLADGGFIVLHETESDGWLYPSDPTEGAEPMGFHAAYPDGYHPVDVAQLPDGRVLILMRRLAVDLPPFSCLIAIADPAQIDSEEDWQVTSLARVEDLLPRDNYEGLAIEPREDGSVTLWLVSDDNQSSLQNWLLAKLRWDPPAAQTEKGARNEPDAPQIPSEQEN